MTNCVFCKIISKEMPAEVFYEDKKMIAFLDIKPVNPGHALLIPKAHHPSLIETPDETIAEIFVTAKKLMRTIKETMGADYVSLSVVGVEVPHLHLHLIPRYHKDGLQNFWPTKQSEKEERSEIAKRLKKLAS